MHNTDKRPLYFQSWKFIQIFSSFKRHDCSSRCSRFVFLFLFLFLPLWVFLISWRYKMTSLTLKFTIFYVFWAYPGFLIIRWYAFSTYLPTCETQTCSYPIASHRNTIFLIKYNQLKKNARACRSEYPIIQVTHFPMKQPRTWLQTYYPEY